MARTQHATVGFGQASGTFTIANGADGSAVDPVDLGRPFSFIRLVCADAQFIPVSTTVAVWLGFTDNDTLVRALDKDDWTVYNGEGDLQTSGTFTMLLPPELTMGAQRIRLVLSNNATGGSVVFTVYGFDAGID